MKTYTYSGARFLTACGGSLIHCSFLQRTVQPAVARSFMVVFCSGLCSRRLHSPLQKTTEKLLRTAAGGEES